MIKMSTCSTLVSVGNILKQGGEESKSVLPRTVSFIEVKPLAFSHFYDESFDVVSQRGDPVLVSINSRGGGLLERHRR